MFIKLRKIKKSDLPLFLKWWKDQDLIALTSGNFDEPGEKLPGYFFKMLESKKKGIEKYPENRYQPVTLKMILNKISQKKYKKFLIASDNSVHAVQEKVCE
ncbi:MAG: hypothetical protein ACOYUZ_02920 [Patescibacteria group bacterium]